MALKAAALLCTSGSETALRIYDRKEKRREGGEQRRDEERIGQKRGKKGRAETREGRRRKEEIREKQR